MVSLNINPSPKNSTRNAIQNKPFVKENALGLPTKKPNHKTSEGKRRSISLNVAVANELSSLNQNGEVYKIQISAIGKLFSLKMV